MVASPQDNHWAGRGVLGKFGPAVTASEGCRSTPNAAATNRRLVATFFCTLSVFLIDDC